MTENNYIKRKSTLMSQEDLDTDLKIKSLSSTMKDKDNGRNDKSKIFPSNREKYFSLVEYILHKEKSLKSEEEIRFMRYYLYSFNNFIDKFKGMQSSLDDLISKISIELAHESAPINNIVFKEGDKPEKFYIILSGEVAKLVRNEVSVHLSRINYVKYLIYLYYYKDYDIISTIISLNSEILNITYDNLKKLIELFSFYKYIKDNNLTKFQFKNIHDFIRKNLYNMTLFLQKKLDVKPLEDVVKLLHFSEEDIMELYYYFNNLVDYYLVHIENEGPVKNTKRESMSNFKLGFTRKNTIRGKTNMKNFISLDVCENSQRNSHYEGFMNKIQNADLYNYPNYYICSVNEYIERCSHFIQKKKKEETFGLKIINLSVEYILKEGDVFGENSYNKNGKRNCTIIVNKESNFGIMTKQQYDNFIKITEDRVKMFNMNFLLNASIFKKINVTYFDKNLYKYFEYKILEKDEKLFEADQKLENIYFIQHGEVEMSAEITFPQLNEIIKYLSGKDYFTKYQDINYFPIVQYKNNYLGFQKYYYEDKHFFKFCVLKDNEIAGLEDFAIKKRYYCDCKCIEKNTKVFKVSHANFNNNFYDGLINRNLEHHLRRHRELILERLVNMRNGMVKIKVNSFERELQEFNQGLFHQTKKKCKLVLMSNNSITDKTFSSHNINDTLNSTSRYNTTNTKISLNLSKPKNPFKHDSTTNFHLTLSKDKIICKQNVLKLLNNRKEKDLSQRFNNYNTISNSLGNSVNINSLFNSTIQSNEQRKYNDNSKSVNSKKYLYDEIVLQKSDKSKSKKNKKLKFLTTSNKTSSIINNINSGNKTLNSDCFKTINVSEFKIPNAKQSTNYLTSTIQSSLPNISNRDSYLDVIGISRNQFTKVKRIKKINLFYKDKNPNIWVKRQMKETKTDYFSFKALPSNSNYYMDNQYLFTNLMNQSPPKRKAETGLNIGVMDCLCLDNWIVKSKNP